MLFYLDSHISGMAPGVAVLGGWSPGQLSVHNFAPDLNILTNIG